MFIIIYIIPSTVVYIYSLVGEVHEIARSVDALMQRLNEAENALKDLQVHSYNCLIEVLLM